MVILMGSASLGLDVIDDDIETAHILKCDAYGLFNPLQGKSNPIIVRLIYDLV